MAPGTLRSRRLALALLFAGACSAFLPGCGMMGWTEAKFKATRTSTLPHVAGKAVDVQTDNGSISVVKAASSEVTITASLKAISQERLDAATVTAGRNERGTLVVRVVWPDRRQSSEGCSFEIALPDAVGATLTTSNGAVNIAGLSGPADLHSSNGAIVAKDHAGTIDAETSNGKIELVDVGSPVKASTSNGSITLVLRADAPGPVNLASSNGSLDLTLSSVFAGSLTADTSNGSVTVTSAAMPPTGSVTKNAAVLVFGAASGSSPPPASKAATSNGDIKISARRPV